MVRRAGGRRTLLRQAPAPLVRPGRRRDRDRGRRQLVLALQHQRLADDARRVALVEDRARRLEQRVETLEHELEERYGFDRLIGRAPARREALARAAKVAATEMRVLMTGESGTGKELVARAIHHASPGADGPFVAVNCAAIPDSLLDSELFGHQRGAFTEADRQRSGRFERAAGGTLFLDEVGELSQLYTRMKRFGFES